MIFVTVGTTKFDKLIEEVDRLAGNGFFEYRVTCQIGSGEYIPKHCDYFRFKPSINDYFQKSNLVITHGGLTVLHMLGQQKKFVAIANTVLAEDHQTSFLNHISKHTKIFWSRDPNALETLVIKALSNAPSTLKMPSLPDKISALINSEP